jgi:hypothetical protein
VYDSDYAINLLVHLHLPVWFCVPPCSAKASGFEASSDAFPSPEAAGQAGRPGAAALEFFALTLAHQPHCLPSQTHVTSSTVLCSAKASGFEASGDASPSPEAAGQAGGPGVGMMGDIMDAMGGAFAGDGKRVEKAVEDLTHQGTGDSCWFSCMELYLFGDTHSCLCLSGVWLACIVG